MKRGRAPSPANKLNGSGRACPPEPELSPAYAFDCEMIQADFPGQDRFQCVVSVGVVDERLEKILEARIKIPPGCRVVDDSFARAQGGLHPDWNKGIERRAATSLLTRFAATGVFVGWQLDSDLRCLGFERAADQAKDTGGWDPKSRTDSSTPGQREGLSLAHGAQLQHCARDTVTIFELTDYFRTTNGRKCQLVEAYQYIFGKALDAHNAAADAQMTMELYNWWIKQGRPARGALGGGTIQPARNCAIDVKWYKVEARAFSPPGERMSHLWHFIRQTTVHREMARESGKVGPGTAPFTLRFRSEPERAAYLNTLRQKIAAKAAAAGGQPPGVGLRWEEPRGGGSGPGHAAGEVLVRCGAFELLVSDEAR